MVREAKKWLESTLSGKVAPTLLALLCAGAIGTGANVVLSVGRLEVKLEKINQQNEQQDSRLDRHDDRITYIERQRAANLGPVAEGND